MSDNIDELLDNAGIKQDNPDDKRSRNLSYLLCDHSELRVTGEMYQTKCHYKPNVIGTEPPYFRIRCAKCSDKRGYIGSELLNLFDIPEEYREPGIWGPERNLTIDLK